MTEYQRPTLLFSEHLETIYPALLRRVRGTPYLRERIATPDDDFLDLDWLKQGSKKAVIISHGLEGNSSRAYMRGMANAIYDKKYDVVAWNFRGCSEEINRQLRFYHSGATDDLELVVRHTINSGYSEIYMIGFSLGGNLTLKYLGEKSPYDIIRKAVVFSVPIDLHSSCLEISKPSNWIYQNRFLKSLKRKIILKSQHLVDIETSGLKQTRSLLEFDDRYTAPLHGFANAIDYYTRCSSRYFLDAIKTPTLLVNARNDPFLSKACYPIKQVQHHAFLKFESPAHGGHVGFAQFNKNGLYWSEERALAFLSQ